ncbi:MAG: hypothetical protein LBC81_05085 [Tannerellaceae bacterium]|nr:hypothetical protein [Tannerellaceae bacterium]
MRTQLPATAAGKTTAGRRNNHPIGINKILQPQQIACNHSRRHKSRQH